MRHLARPTAVLTAALATAALLAGCTIATETAPPPPESAGPTDAAGAATPAVRTPDLTAVAEDAVFGRWRRAPAHPTPAIAQAAESACRAEAAVGALPLVVLDARGEGEVTVVFADAKAASLCHARVAKDGTATADARPVAGYPDAAPASQRLGVHDLEIVDSSSGARTVLVGQVGPDVARVAAQFDDATWSNASMAQGWYAMWWPGREPALTVAAVNNRSEAVDGFAPKPVPTPTP
jgi:hypothetical protein